MKILVDENIPIKTANALRDSGHTVKDIQGILIKIIQTINHGK